jgi:hypothetical protein
MTGRQKALICYWGLVRGFKYPQALESHRKHIWKVLEAQGFEYDVLVHTYNKEFDTNLFNVPNIRYLLIEDDAYITQRILPRIRNVHLPPYFEDEHKTGLFKCWHSQRQLREQLKKIKDDYDVVITLDIAQYFVSPIPDNLDDLDMTKVYLSDFEKFKGYNPRFCMSNPKNVMFYLNKFDYVLNDEEKIPKGMIDPEYLEDFLKKLADVLGVEPDAVKKCPNLHPEWQLKKYLDVVGGLEVVELPIKFYRIRRNAELVGITQEDVDLYSVTATAT